MSKEMEKAYEAKKYEKEIYQMWESGDFFQAKVDESRKPFSISMPPPNATGVLHIGHSVFLTVQDIVARYKRMSGYNVLWLPGTDHAAIATQTKVEKIIAKEGLKKEDLGREKFLERVKQYVEESRGTIRKQIRAMGASCDWGREAYTFSDDLSLAVNTAFSKLYNDGLIYRGYRIVNWCPRCASTLADDEIEYKKEKTILYTFKYDKNFPIAISTTRPETKLGDTAVAVNPDDKRYEQYIGKEFAVDFCGKQLQIKIVADKAVEMDFGTGALGVTPAHSQIDYEMAQKNNLDVIKIIDEKGLMNENSGSFAGLTVLEARKKVIECLSEKGLIEKEEEIEHNLSICYRCGTPVEPLTSEQWFIDVNKKVGGWDYKKLDLSDDEKYSLKEVALSVVRNGQIEIIPKRLEKTYFDWMENLRDWCISRQIWWGHQIPVWYKKESDIKNGIYVGLMKPEDGDWVRDEDTLDTWFSSALWTFSTLGWPNKTEELKYWHPTSLMETGRDIIFFWVARMILMSTYLMGEIPFEKVYFNGILVDEHGKKMSKSSGTGIDPMEVIDEYGTDALRLSLIVDNPAGKDFYLPKEKIVGQRNFVNKLWNVARFVQMRVKDKNLLAKKIEVEEIVKIGDKLSINDKWILNKLDCLVESMTSDLEKYRFYMAVQKLENFLWHDLADWYLEDAKQREMGEVLVYVLQRLLVLAHPFIPFVTETIWSNFGLDEYNKLIVEKWPILNRFNFAIEEINSEIETVQKVIDGLRNMIGTFGLTQSRDLVIRVCVNDGGNIDKENLAKTIKNMIINVIDVKLVDNLSLSETGLVVEKWETLEVGIEVDENLITEQKIRIQGEIANVEKYIFSLESKLKNENFISRAPKEVVEGEQTKLLEAKKKIDAMKDSLSNLGN